MESVPTPCFNFKGISLSPEFGLHTQITELRCMGINSTCTIDFTQLAFMGSELEGTFVPFDGLAEPPMHIHKLDALWEAQSFL